MSYWRTNRLAMLLFLSITAGLTGSLFMKEPYLWLDEVLTMLLLNDPSVGHMLQAIPTGIDANPPLYFLGFWPLVHFISADVFFLRAVSIGCFAGAVTLFFAYVNRLLPAPGVNFILVTGLVCFTFLNYVQATQIRPYGLYLLLAGCHSLLVHRLIGQPANRRLLIGYGLSGLGLVFVHTFGLLYIGVCAGFFCMLFVWSRQRHYLLVPVLAVGVGAVWFWLWFARMLQQAEVGKPFAWLAEPTLLTFFETAGSLLPALPKLESISVFWFLPVARVLLLAGGFVWISTARLRGGFGAFVHDKAFSLFVLAGFIFGTTLGVTVLVSLLYTSVFIGKYIWPNHLLVLVLVVYSYHWLGLPTRLPVHVQKLLPVYALAFASVLGVQNTRWSYFESEPIQTLHRLDQRYPVFYESSLHFLPVWYHRLTNAYFVLDWRTAYQTRATTEFKVLEAIREKYGLSGIVTANELAQPRFAHFYVFDDANDPKFEQLLRNRHLRVIRTVPTANPRYRILECVR